MICGKPTDRNFDDDSQISRIQSDFYESIINSVINLLFHIMEQISDMSKKPNRWHAIRNPLDSTNTSLARLGKTTYKPIFAVVVSCTLNLD